jgi:type 1 glutamine amidotransferase
LANVRSALIVWGGWDGHEPKQVAEVFRKSLIDEGFDVQVCDTLDIYSDGEYLKSLNLIVPVWTMGEISAEHLNSLTTAIQSGVGLAGCHGGMCDSFRGATEYHFMTGGQWVAHPGDQIDYSVRVTQPDHFITEGAPLEFSLKSEQYYLHVDPAVRVLAVTQFPVADGPHSPNGAVDMPVIWTKYYGKGRVAYNSLGHNKAVVEHPTIYKLLVRSFLWAAKDNH